MNRKNLLVVALLITMLLSLSLYHPVAAHNSGHIFLPDGTCLNVGSILEAPYVGDGNPNQLPTGQLDLIPGSGDQYGARYAADQGNTPILPGECPIQ